MRQFRSRGSFGGRVEEHASIYTRAGWRGWFGLIVKGLAGAQDAWFCALRNGPNWGTRWVRWYSAEPAQLRITEQNEFVELPGKIASASIARFAERTQFGERRWLLMPNAASALGSGWDL